MMDHSHERQHHYQIILIAVLLVHGAVLFFTFKAQEDEKRAISAHQKTSTTTQPINVKFVKVKKFLSDRMKQIVESEDPADLKKPDNSRFMSDKDRTFDRQTLARKIGPFQKAARPRENDGGPKDASKFKDLKLSDLGQPAERHPLMAAAKEYAQRGSTKARDEHGASVSSTSDYVEGVPLGDLTQLNTQEYKYYGFYHRIKIKLEQFWGRSIHEKAELMTKTGRHLAEDSDVITALRVTLDELGEIIAIAVVGASGIRELDDAAIESFNQAGPFPNPPKGMLVDGKVVIEWGFVVKS